MKKLVSILVMGVFLISCASSTQKTINDDREMLSPMMSKQEMVDKISLSLEKIPHLNLEQREQLSALHADVLTQSWEINQEIRQHKVLLFKYLAEENYKQKKVNMVKRKVEKLYKKKLNLMLSSFEKVKHLLGKDSRRVLEHHDFIRFHGIGI